MTDESKSAAEKALDEIAELCGCRHWDYPGQVVRDVKRVVERLEKLEENRLVAKERA